MRVALENVTKKFGKVTAVDSLNLSVGDDDFLVLLGPSGCGKTTTLRLVAGLEDLTGGHIYIGDRLVNEVPAKERNVAMVFQSYALYPHMNVYDNMALALKVRKIPREEIHGRVLRAARLLKIEDLLTRKPRELSGGQRQRVALGRAIVREPDVFLMDEPLSNLDAKLRVHMRIELKKLHLALRTSFIYVTHDQLEAMTLGTRVAVMNNAVLQQVGSPDELYDKPANEFVAGFIGSPAMNMHKGSIDERDGKIAVDLGPISYTLPHDIAGFVRQTNPAEVVLGIRPEDIVVGNGEFEAVVDVSEPLGSEFIVYLKVGELTYVAKVSSRQRLVMGQKLRISFDPQKIHLFSQGRAIV